MITQPTVEKQQKQAGIIVLLFIHQLFTQIILYHKLFLTFIKCFVLYLPFFHCTVATFTHDFFVFHENRKYQVSI